MLLVGIFVWGILFAALLGAVLAHLANRHYAVPRPLRGRRTIFWFCAPCVYVVWFIPGCFLAAKYIDAIDPDRSHYHGASHTIGLPDEYTVLLDEDRNRGRLVGPMGDVLAYGVTMIARADTVVYGQSREGGFMLKTSTGRFTEGDAPGLFARYGLDPEQLRDVADCTDAREMGLHDWAAFIFLFIGIPTLLLIAIWRYYCRRLGPYEHAAWLRSL